ncbi:MAG TPA: DUF4333 domain-containing protein [Capillimicrobium sp.]|nr:DUF4333 domain-containing protein [Capillimicrobium sp.]
MRPTLILPAIAGVAVALGVAACGDKTIDHEDLQETLGTQLSQQAGVDPAQVSVSCPEGQEVEQGNEFDCELTAPNGDKVRVIVTLTDDDGGFTATVPEEEGS